MPKLPPDSLAPRKGSLQKGFDAPLTNARREQDVRIEEGEKILLEAAVPHNTKRAYRAEWKLFTAWCAVRGDVPMPASPDVLRAYAIDRTTRPWPKKGREAAPDAPPTIERRVAAIVALHGMAGHPTPRDAKLKRLLIGIRKKLRVSVTKAAPLLAEQLKRICAIEARGLLAARDRAMILVGWSCALRRSELVSLRIEDVRLLPTGDAYELKLYGTKTDKEGVGQSVVVETAVNVSTCPFRALRSWLGRLDKNVTCGPLFPRIDRGETLTSRFMDDGHVTAVVRAAVASIGEDPAGYSGHSLRAGYVTQGILSGVSETVLRQQTRHRSSKAFDEYVRPLRMSLQDSLKKMGL